MIEQILKRTTFDSDTNPAILKVQSATATHTAFCFALGVDKKELKFVMFGGNDSALQSIKSLMSIKTRGLFFGEGRKEVLGYELGAHFQLDIKEQMEFIQTQTESKKKAIIGFAKSVKDKYIVAIDESPAKLVRDFLMAAPYGLPILKEWETAVYEELIAKDLLKPLSVYFDQNEFLSIQLFEVVLKEEDCTEFLSELIKSGKVQFPQAGTGEKLQDLNNINDYLLTYSPMMLEQLTKENQPLHDPLKHEPLAHFDSYKRLLFPVQAHVATGAIKALQVQKGIIIQGEMSTGKSAMMTASIDGYFAKKGKKGYFACLMVPPTLTEKWAKEEIFHLIPDAEVHLISSTEELIRYHQKWIQNGRPKPQKPTFFVISFTTMRGDSIKYMPIPYQAIERNKRQEDTETQYHKKGYYCPDCGERLSYKVSSTTVLDKEGNETEVATYNEFVYGEFVSKTNKNSSCCKCGSQLWAPKVKTRYGSFKEWTQYENRLVSAIREKNDILKQQIILANRSQKLDARHTGTAYRKVAAIEYIRRKMKKFFDIALCDEVHEVKSGETAQGNAFGSLVAASKKFICGTGTLFGGKASDVFYLLWRTFPHKMVQQGLTYNSIMEWNEMYGNVERTVYHDHKDGASNVASRGRKGRDDRSKVVPGISPYVFSNFMIDTVINVRLKDVWPNPVELLNVPTVLVDMTDEMKQAYNHMQDCFEKEIELYKGQPESGKMLLSYLRTGVAYPDNMIQYPSYFLKSVTEEKRLIWSSKEYALSADCITPKEKKLQEILQTEISEGRPTIIYVADTGTSNEERDVQPRLQYVAEQIPGAKVAILRTNTVKPPKRSKWLKDQVRKGVNVVICSQELVKVGLDLLVTPTLIFYQFSWSLFTINQASRRHWRIGQQKECRTYWLAYRETMQEQMALIIAQKNKAAEAMNGEATSDGLNAMLGDDGDLQSMLLNSIKNGEKLNGSTEEWTALASERTKELLANIGKIHDMPPADILPLDQQVSAWIESLPASYDVGFLREGMFLTTVLEAIEQGTVPGIDVVKGVLEVTGDTAAVIRSLSALGVKKKERIVAPKTVQEESSVWNLFVVENHTTTKGKKRNKKVEAGQIGFDLFAL